MALASKHLRSGIAGTMAYLLCGVGTVAGQSQTGGSDGGATGIPQDPSFLLGTWHITEDIYPGTDRAYTETSVRVCTAVLMETYVQCKTLANGRGRQREYWFLVNQPGDEGTIEFVGMGTNYTAKSLYRGTFLSDGSGIDLRSYEIEADALTPGTYQRLRFESPDAFVWTIGITNPGTPDESVIGIERAVRVSPDPPTS